MSKPTTRLLKLRSEPAMSDRTILIRVEDLISAAFGSIKENTVDFKLMHTVFSILARQMRILEQEVDMRHEDLFDSSGRSSGDEKGTNIGRIKTVTLSEFNLLYDQVQRLQATAVPQQPPKTDQTIAQAIAQLRARVAAAEHAVETLIDLLTKLVLMGVIPAHLLGKLGLNIADLQAAAAAAGGGGDPSDQDYVTERILKNGADYTEEEIMKILREMADKAAGMADTTTAAAEKVSENASLVDNLGNRMSDLTSLTAEYMEKLTALAAVIQNQLNDFDKEMAELLAAVKAAMQRLQNPGSVQAAALQGLKNSFEDVMADLAQEKTELQSLMDIKNRLMAELARQNKSVNTLLEQKAETEELRKGLDDKVDLAALTGWLPDETLELARCELDAQMLRCYELFKAHDKKWTDAAKELQKLYCYKADISRMFEVRDSATRQLNEMRDKLDELYDLLGDPQAAILARQLSKDGWCGDCLVATLMRPADPKARLPPRLPAIRKKLEEELRPVKDLDWGPCPKLESRDYDMCNRYVGGSHTIHHGAIKKPQPPEIPPVPTRKYIAKSCDGALYMMEEAYQPCVECNDPAAGDSARF